jgi:hypothetical protein
MNLLSKQQAKKLKETVLLQPSLRDITSDDQQSAPIFVQDIVREISDNSPSP